MPSAPTPMHSARFGPPDRDDAGRARHAMLLVTLLWGLNWPAARFALQDFSPWLFRLLSFAGGGLLLLWVARRRGIALGIAKGWPRCHVLIAGLLGTGGFGLLTAFAQRGGSTSRTAICVYTMPFWAALLARLFLGERLTRRRALAVLIAATGLAVLLLPLLHDGLPPAVWYALAAAVSWAAGSVYLKWARIKAEPVALAAWQLLAGALLVAPGLLLDGGAYPSTLHGLPLLGLLYSTLLGTALAYWLWFYALSRLSAGAVALGTLLVPVIGVAAAMLLLGERPAAPDLAGLAMICLAALSSVGAAQKS